MGILSRFENKMEDGIEGAAGMLGRSGISPVQITKRAEKVMRREKVVGAGKQYAPTLYTVLISSQDDSKLFKYYPTLAGETETYLTARARELGYVMDGQPLVRFLADPDLKKGKFEVVGELVASAVVERLRDDEMKRYGLPTKGKSSRARANSIQVDRNLQPNLQPLPNLQRNRPADALARAQSMSIEGGNVYKVGPEGGYQDIHHAEPRQAAQGQHYDEIASNEQEDQYEQFDQFEQSDEYDELESPTQEHHHEPPIADTNDANGQAQASASPGTNVYLYDESRDWAVELSGAPQRIGREVGNDIVIPDINASRVHAEIMRQQNGIWAITDLDSTNGLLINGRKVKSAPLRDADMITIGATTLEFQQLA